MSAVQTSESRVAAIPPSQRDEIIGTVRSYLVGEFPDRADALRAVRASASLFDEGFLDSLSFLGLVTFLEQRYSISIPPQDFITDLFGSLDRVAAYVSKAVANGG